MISVEVDGEEIENVGEVVYLRGLLTLNDDCGKEMRSKNSKVSWSNGGFWNIRNSGETRVKILKTDIQRLLYVCDSWMFRTEDKNRLLVFEMRCYKTL